MGRLDGMGTMSKLNEFQATQARVEELLLEKFYNILCKNAPEQPSPGDSDTLHGFYEGYYQAIEDFRLAMEDHNLDMEHRALGY